jgi:hypothetical protein
MSRYSYRKLSPALKAAGLAVLVGLTRLPFHSHYLFDWDAANFAFSLKKFDIATHQPHPPGYPLIVAAARLAHFFFSDANTALVAVSIAASAGSVVFLYLLGRQIYGEKIALAAALALIVNPVFWFYGEVAAAYAPEACVSTAVAYFAFRVNRKDLSPYWLTLIFALAGGVRPNVLILLAPLYLWALLASGISWRGTLKQAGVFVLGIALWLVPLLKASGGLQNYLAAGKALSIATFSITSIAYLGWEGVLSNSWRFFGWLAACSGLLIIPAIWWLVRERRRLLAPWQAERMRAFFLVWIFPPAFFYWATHIPKAGYLLTFIAALHLLFMRAAIELTGKRGAALAIAASIAVFLFARPLNAPWSEPMTLRYAVDFLWLRYNVTALRQNDRAMASYLAPVRAFPPGAAALLLDWEKVHREDPDWRVISYYLPDYPVYCLSFDKDVRPAYLFAQGGQSPVPLTNSLHATPLPLGKEVKQLLLISSQMDKVAGREDTTAQPLFGSAKLLVKSVSTSQTSFAGYQFSKISQSPLSYLYRHSPYFTSLKTYWREPRPNSAAVSTCK